MTIPTYPTGTGTGKLNSTHANQIINAINGFSASGTFRAPYTFLVTTDGTDAYASNAFQTVYGGASDAGSVDGGDASAVIQAALDNLTAGRSWYETVAVRGSFSIDTTLTMSAYTILDLSNALLTAAAPFTGEDIVKANGLNCVVMGGKIDGNGINVHGVRGFYGNLTVKDLEVINVGYNCISVWATFRDCENVTFQNCTGSTTHATGWPPFANTNAGSGDSFKTLNVNFIDCTSLGSANDCGFLIEGGCKYTTFNHCYSRNAGRTGGFFTDVMVDGTPYFTQFINCTAINNTGFGFGTEGLYTSYTNCYAEGNGYDGYFCNADSKHTTFTNCTALNNGVTATWGRVNGLYLEALASYVNLYGCTFTDDQVAPTQEYAIRAGAGCNHINIGARQMLLGNKTAVLFFDSTVTNVSMPSFTVPFVIGSPTAGPYTVTNYDFEGWDIDESAEFAATYFGIPADLNQIIDVTVEAYSVVDETHGMRAELVLYAGAANEARNTHGPNATMTSTTTGFSAGENIKWVFTSAEDTTDSLELIAPGDMCRFHVIYAAADGSGNCATDARFKSVTIHYI